jgi:hypothetical protein
MKPKEQPVKKGPSEEERKISLAKLNPGDFLCF